MTESPIEPPEDIPPVSAEHLVDGEPEVEPPPPPPRRYPSTIGGAFYLLVLVLTIAGLVVTALGEWRFGVRIVGGSLLFAALVRVVLRPVDAGMLGVRNKVVDAVLLVLAGAVLIFLAGSIPDQPV
ncbi:MAG: DUF3017 domain-containing protein [Nocardioidaceae bacterium]